MNDPKPSREGGEAVRSTALFDIPFTDLYHEARRLGDRILLVWLAKEYHIRKQNFSEASTMRKIEQDLRKELEQADALLGADILSNDKLTDPAAKNQ